MLGLKFYGANLNKNKNTYTSLLLSKPVHTTYINYHYTTKYIYTVVVVCSVYINEYILSVLICFIFDIELLLPYNIENRYCMPNMLSTVNKDGTDLLTVLEQLIVSVTNRYPCQQPARIHCHPKGQNRTCQG